MCRAAIADSNLTPNQPARPLSQVRATLLMLTVNLRLISLDVAGMMEFVYSLMSQPAATPASHTRHGINTDSACCK